jgi:hypothetical protein
MDIQAKSAVILLSDKHNYINIVCLVSIQYYHMFRPYTSAIISRALVHKNSEKGRDLCLWKETSPFFLFLWTNVLICTVETCGSIE